MATVSPRMSSIFFCCLLSPFFWPKGRGRPGYGGSRSPLCPSTSRGSRFESLFHVRRRVRATIYRRSPVVRRGFNNEGGLSEPAVTSPSLSRCSDFLAGKETGPDGVHDVRTSGLQALASSLTMDISGSMRRNTLNERASCLGN